MRFLSKKDVCVHFALTQKGKDSITSEPRKIQKIKKANKKPLTFFQWLFKLIKNQFK